MATDWTKLGLKIGLEIHQQLDGQKLFCDCPTTIRDDTPHATIKRRLRAVAGESGDIDVAALREVQKGKHFHYENYHDTTCLVETDEEPPHELNPAAIHATLQFCKLTNARPVDQIRVMRKTVVDGSNTSGFQRTALIATGGQIKTKDGNVRIATICLEEDAARIIKRETDHTIYRLDRLGIPLIEIATQPDIKTPEQCAEAAETIGLLIRSTGKAKRGLGTIRQDVNISTTGAPRIEIKGVQALDLIPTVVQLEAERQQQLIDTAKKLNERKAKSDDNVHDITDALSSSQSKIVTGALEKRGIIIGVKLSGYAGLIGPTKLGKELAGRARVYAGVGGIVHSDELPAYGITDTDTANVKHALHCGQNDAFVFVADAHDKADAAIKAVIERATEALSGVPKEVRNANEDGTTSFLRPMPGAARMYPETDVPPIIIDEKTYQAIPLPETIDAKQKRYEKLGLAKDLAELTARSERAALFDECVKAYPSLKPAYIAEIVMTADKTIKRQFGVDIGATEEDYRSLLGALSDGTISKESVLDILKENKPVKDVLGKHKAMSDKELDAALKQIVTENKGMPFNALIGKAMAQLRGKASGQKIAELLKKLAG